MCPAVTSFSINEGWSHIVQHNKGKLHNEKLLESQTDPLFKQLNNSVPLITDGLKKMEE